MKAGTFFIHFMLLTLGIGCGWMQGIQGQTAPFPLGTILDSVSLEEWGQESYALYLPKEFRNSELSPLLAIFDPAARGRNGITPFLEASEKYGFILVASNDSRNGPYERNYEIANRLFRDVLRRFQVDADRIYVAGFSGGARLASAIAVITEQIQGVIACGAGFASNQLAAEPTFSYAAVIGNRDFNYWELQKTAGWLDRLGASNELFELDMGHQWPSSAQLKPVFQWLWLQASRNGLVPADTTETEAIYQEFLQQAREMENAREWVGASGWYDRILRNFPERSARDQISDHLFQLKQLPEYQRALESWKACQATEEKETARLYERFRRDIQKPDPDISWWEKALQRLEARVRADNVYKKRMVARIRATVAAFTYEVDAQQPQKASLRIFCETLRNLALKAESGTP